MTGAAHLLSDEEFRAAHRAGHTVREVAILDGTTQTTVCRRASRMGIKFCNKPGGKPDLERAAKARVMRTEGKTYSAIGRALSCSSSAAWWWCQ